MGLVARMGTIGPAVWKSTAPGSWTGSDIPRYPGRKAGAMLSRHMT
eukprot:COSAG01_NODE_4134_length_5316_cov_6.930255_11_plen_45_part_01